MLEERIEQDIKTALLAREAQRVTVLRGLKATLLDLKVATGKRETGLSDDEVLKTLAKESKKRQDSADLYKQGGSPERYEAELQEKAIIDEYLPAQLSDDELIKMIDEVIQQTGASGPQAMGQVIGQVKAKAGATADGGAIARLVKERI